MPKNHRKKAGPKNATNLSVQAILLVVLILALSFFVYKNGSLSDSDEPTENPAVTIKPGTDVSDTLESPELTQEPADNVEVTPAALPAFEPYSTDNTKPEALLSLTGLMVDGVTAETYELPEKIDFGYGSDYTELEGIITFRGNNFRDSASYGTANLIDKKFGEYWSRGTGALSGADGTTWTGSGWTGQPLIVNWPKETRKIMNMYDWAKGKEELVEVIYATMDGNIYFMELGSGSYTRDPMYLGYTFKGAGALDPRGYPILYLGAGYDSIYGTSRAFIISLIDCSVMYEFGNNDGFSLRGSLSYFDSSALVDAETDQLIYPGENGILYIMKLNSDYDPASGELSIDPSNIVKWHYKGNRTGNQYWVGMEDSAVIWRSHIIMSDNGGNLICLDLSTLEVVWVQDVLDDTNCSPVLELENGHPYVYISTSFHAGWRAYEGQTAVVPIWKIDAVTGEVVWRTDYNCHTVSGVSGGVQGTLAIGKNSLDDIIFVPMARTGSASAGKLVALSKETGDVIWEYSTLIYSWSSPVTFYDDAGNGYILTCTSGGYMYLLDGLTGKVLDSIDLGGNIEASPAIYMDTVVVGTRSQYIWGIKLH